MSKANTNPTVEVIEDFFRKFVEEINQQTRYGKEEDAESRKVVEDVIKQIPVPKFFEILSTQIVDALSKKMLEQEKKDAERHFPESCCFTAEYEYDGDHQFSYCIRRGDMVIEIPRVHEQMYFSKDPRDRVLIHDFGTDFDRQFDEHFAGAKIKICKIKAAFETTEEISEFKIPD